MTASQLKTYYENLVQLDNYNEESAIDEALNNAKGDSERTQFLASIGKDPKAYLSIGSSTGGSASIEALKKKYGELAEITRYAIQNETAKDKLKNYYLEDNSIEGLKNLISGMKAESSEAGYIYDILDDVFKENPTYGFEKVVKDYADKFSTDDFYNSAKYFIAALEEINKYTEALQDMKIDDNERAIYIDSMYSNLIDKVADAKKIDATPTDFNDNLDDMKYRFGETLIDYVDKNNDESFIKRSDGVKAYAKEKLMAKEEANRKKAKEDFNKALKSTSKQAEDYQKTVQAARKIGLML